VTRALRLTPSLTLDAVRAACAVAIADARHEVAMFLRDECRRDIVVTGQAQVVLVSADGERIGGPIACLYTSAMRAHHLAAWLAAAQQHGAVTVQIQRFISTAERVGADPEPTDVDWLVDLHV